MEINRLTEANNAFRRFEKELSSFSVSDNRANKLMSLLLSSLESFELISTRYAGIRNKIQEIHKEEFVQRAANPEKKSWPAHPDERYCYAAIRVDVESLFMFGTIIVRRTLPLIELFLSDRPPGKRFDDLGNFYGWITTESKLSSMATELKNNLGPHFRWLYAVLRFYRNKFVEHLSEPQQQGMNFDLGGKKFALHSYKWDFNTDDEKAISNFKAQLEKRGVKMPTVHGLRHYVQMVFDNLDQVPEDFLQDALRLIDNIGIDSPAPATLINHIELYLRDLFNFMSDHIQDSDLAQYQK
jgi:frataxin-like iron-binding protein CyaY